MDTGRVNHAREILSAIDAKIDRAIELTLYGRAALALGFENAPPEYFQSKDVDVVLWLRQGEELLEHTNFWDVVQEVNEEFRDQERYISHLFEETQVVLTPEWKEQRILIKGDWQKLSIYRLGDQDLFLSKLMRDDPQDLADARFIAVRAGWDSKDTAEVIGRARVPNMPALREEFSQTARQFLALHPDRTLRVTLESAAIDAVTYSPDDQTLDVEFRSSGNYRYLKVPRSTYQDLLKAESAGAYWNEVKGDYAYIRLS